MFRTKGEQKLEIPTVCVVNAATASSAELFAYTLRTLNGARLVGETTLGKGTVQSQPQRMSDGSAVVITMGKQLTCDGASFEGAGVAVDVERLLTAEEQAGFYDYTTQTDPQLLRAFEVADSLTGNSTVGEAENIASSSASSAPEGEEDGAAEGSEGGEEDAASASSDAA